MKNPHSIVNDANPKSPNRAENKEPLSILNDANSNSPNIAKNKEPLSIQNGTPYLLTRP